MQEHHLNQTNSGETVVADSTKNQKPSELREVSTSMRHNNTAIILASS